MAPQLSAGIHSEAGPETGLATEDRKVAAQSLLASGVEGNPHTAKMGRHLVPERTQSESIQVSALQGDLCFSNEILADSAKVVLESDLGRALAISHLTDSKQTCRFQ